MKNRLIILIILSIVILSCTKNVELSDNQSVEQETEISLEKIKECEKDLDCPQPKCIGVRAFCDNEICKLEGECLSKEDLKSKGNECNSDLDCVKAGCSSQLCVPKEKSDILTTCEYKQEYECLKKTICGCVKNKCEWKETAPYRECLVNHKY